MFTNFVNMFDLPGNKYTDMMVKYYEKKYRMKISSLDPIEFAKKLSLKSLIVHCRDDRDADVHLSEELHKEIPKSTSDPLCDATTLTPGLGPGLWARK